MMENLAGLTPASLRAAVHALPRRALQQLAKAQGLKANLASSSITQQLLQQFTSTTEAATLDVAEARSPLSSAGYSQQQQFAAPSSELEAACGMPAPSPGSFNPLFFLDKSPGQEAATARAAAVEAAGQQQATEMHHGADERPASTSGSDGALHAAPEAPAAAKRPRVAGGKRKGRDAEEDAAGIKGPALKRQGTTQAKAAGRSENLAVQPNGAKPVSAPAEQVAAPAALLDCNGASGPAGGSGAKTTQPGAMAGAAKTAKLATSRPPAAAAARPSVPERARKAEEAHAKRRAAAAAKGQNRGR